MISPCLVSGWKKNTADMEKTDELLQLVRESLAIELKSVRSRDELRQQLAAYFNELIQADFSRLVSLLYRVDVDETKLRRRLAEFPDTDAGLVLADLFIERQVQKIQTRQSFQPGSSHDSEEERW